MGFGPATGPTLKTALCHIRALVGRNNKYRGPCSFLGCVWPFLSSCWVALGRPFYLWAVLPGVPRYWRVPPASGGHPPRFLSPLGVGLLPGAPKRGMPTGSKVFLALPDACGLRPADFLETYVWHSTLLSSSSYNPAHVPGPTFGFVKLLASSGSHCIKWADEQHRPAGFESRLVPDLPLPFTSTLIVLGAFDLVSSPVWWEAAKKPEPRFPRSFTWSVVRRHGSVLVTNSIDSTRPSCQHRLRPRRSSNAASSPRNDSLLRTAFALQHLAHVRLAVQASNQIDIPPG